MDVSVQHLALAAVLLVLAVVALVVAVVVIKGVLRAGRLTLKLGCILLVVALLLAGSCLGWLALMR